MKFSNFDELKLLTELGHEVYSLGAYTHPYGDDGRKRPGLPDMPYDPHFVELATRYSKDDLHPEMIEPMDAIIVMHEPSFIEQNWGKISHKRVIWRSIGQSIQPVEQRLWMLRKNGLEIVRYSPEEKNIPGFVGEDAVIRFGKDPEEFGNWNGSNPTVVNFTQSVAQRGTHCSWDTMNAVASKVPFKLYGPGNEGISFSGGLLPYEQQKAVLRDSGAYFYTGTHPASYTLNFMEAWMTGIPVVAVGPNLGSPRRSGYQQDTYEVHNLIENGISGFVSDNVDAITGHLQALLADHDYARSISEGGRKAAIKHFSTDTIRAQWKEFLG